MQGASPPHETGRAETVYRDIHLAIVEHRLSPGTRLPEAHLAHVFGVSRTLVRQALQHLAHDHLVVLEPNRGARIAEPSIDEVRQLYEVRRLIECNMLAEGASRITRARLAALRRKVASEAQANARGDTLASMQLAGAFHLDLAEALGNRILVDILGELIARGNVAIALLRTAARPRHLPMRRAPPDRAPARDRRDSGRGIGPAPASPGDWGEPDRRPPAARARQPAGGSGNGTRQAGQEGSARLLSRRLPRLIPVGGRDWRRASGRAGHAGPPELPTSVPSRTTSCRAPSSSPASP